MAVERLLALWRFADRSRALADAEFVPLPCGHQAFAEMPAEFIAAVDPFLDRVTTEEP